MKEEKDITQNQNVEEETTSQEVQIETWKPKTELGKKVLSGEISDIDEIFEKGYKIKEPQIVDLLIPDLQTDLLMIGQAKGKFGGGQRRVFRQTQKKTKEGNKPKFSTLAVVGNKDGYVGVGFGKAKETVPAREKAIRNAKLNLFKIRRGCGSWQCGCKTPHSIPFKVNGKCGSVVITFMPAPKGKGLVCEKEVAKVLKMAGIKDIWAKTRGQARIKMNLIEATVRALQKLINTKIHSGDIEELGIVDGKMIKKEKIESPEIINKEGEAK